MRQRRRQPPMDRPVLHAPLPPTPEIGDKPEGMLPAPPKPETERGVAIVDFYL